MIVAGQTVENPQTGERLVFHRTAAETGGEVTEFEAFIAPGGHLPAAHIHPGQSHNFWNKTDDEVSFKVEVRPALKIESLIETMYGLAADGKTNRWGMPNPFRLAVIAKEHFDTVQMPVLPAWTQRAALALGAPTGRLFGFGHSYTRKPVSATTTVPAYAGRRRPALAVA